MGEHDSHTGVEAAGTSRTRRLFNDRSLVVGLPLAAALVFSSIYFIVHGFGAPAPRPAAASTAPAVVPGGLTVQPLANPATQNASSLNAIDDLQPSTSSPDVPESYYGQPSNTVGPAPRDSGNKLQNVGSTQSLLNGSSHSLKHWQNHQ